MIFLSKILQVTNSLFNVVQSSFPNRQNEDVSCCYRNQETQRYDAPNGDDDDKLISFDTSVNDEAREQEPDVDEQTAEETQKDPDLLGIFDAPQNGGEQSHDHYSAFESSENAKGIRGKVPYLLGLVKVLLFYVFDEYLKKQKVFPLILLSHQV